MTLYLDTSFLTALFKPERRSADVRSFLQSQTSRRATVSRWRQVEFLSFVAKEVRIGKFTPTQAVVADVAFDAFVEQTCSLIDVASHDFDTARRSLADHRSGLRVDDALHLAIASNDAAAGVYSLDRIMVAAGLSLGLPTNAGFIPTI